jgi:hypothetical protein
MNEPRQVSRKSCSVYASSTGLLGCAARRWSQRRRSALTTPLRHDHPGEAVRGVEEARTLTEADPAVKAGKFRVIVLPWMVPAGALHFSSAKFPHSIAEAVG